MSVKTVHQRQVLALRGWSNITMAAELCVACSRAMSLIEVPFRRVLQLPAVIE